MICYTDNAVLIATNEHNLQKLLNSPPYYPIINNQILEQVRKTALAPEALKHIIWQNKNLKLKKIRISIHLLLKQKQILKKNETSNVNVRKDKTQSINECKQQCNIEDIIRCGRARRRNWNQHNFRMGESKLLVRASRDGTEPRPSGRSPK